MSLVLRQFRCLLLVIAASLGLSAADGTGTGLLATYYANETLSGSPAVSRTDAQVNFAWSGGAPASGMPVDSFSARWDGEIEARFTENLTLIARTDDGVRLWLNGQLVIDQWVLRSAADSSYTFAAVAGQKYRIRMEYYEHFGSAVAQLHWKSASIVRAAIPTAYLYPTPAVELPSGTGSGLLARYYANETLSGTPVLARTDARVDFGWGGGSPDGSVPVESFSARWDGEFEARVSEPLTIIARTDDGVRVWINGQVVIDQWVLRSAADSTYTFSAEAGQRYRIRMEYYEHTGAAVARLWWQSANELKGPIPTSQLYPTDPVDPPNGTGTGLLVSYFANETLSGAPVLSRTEARVDHNWGGGSPGPGVPVDVFSARWQGEIEPRVSETLTLIARTDDGVRLWIDGQLVIDQWVLRGAADSTYTFSAEAGRKYRIRMEYFEHLGSAVAKLWWQSASEPKSPIPTSQLYPTEPPVPPAGSGTGLFATYFANETLSGDPILSRVEPRIDYNWGGGSPGSPVPADVFSARWEGEIEPRVSEPLTIIARTDDGVRVWLDDVQVINAWVLRSAADSTYTFTPVAGQRYRIRMEYYEHLGSAVAKLWWQSANEPRGPIPTSQLYPSTGTPTTPTIAFATAGTTVVETVGSTAVAVTLSAPAATNVTVAIQSDGSGATAPATVTFPAGTTTASIPVTISDDPRFGPDRQVTLSLVNPVGADLGLVTSHVLTIQNTDAAPTIAFTAPTSFNLEQSGTASVIVRLSAVTAQTTTVTVNLSGSATAGLDYQAPSATLQIPADTFEGTIFIPLLADVLAEQDETIVLTLSAPVGATLSSPSVHTITLSDGNQTPIIVTGPTPAANPVSGTSVELSLMVSDDGAPADLTTTWSVVGAPVGSVTFAPSTGTGFTVSTVATANAFGTYIIQATTSDAYQATVSAQTTVTFVAPKQSQTITFTALPSKTYGDAPFALSATASSGLPVSYSSSDTSVATISGNTVTIVGAGSTSITATQEGNASWEAAASVAQVLTVAKATQTITFAALPSVTYGDAPLALTATASSGLPVSFSSSDTAVATISGSTLTIVGVGSATITASQDGDANVAAAAPVERLLSVAPATSVTIAATTPETSQGQPEAPGILTVTRTGDLTSPLTVSYTVGGTAVSGVAYASLSGGVVIPASASSATIAVVPVAPEDGVANPDVTVIVTVVPTATYTVGPQASATVTIHDPNSLDATIAIDQATRFQTLDGIGGNFANGRFDGSDQPNDAVGAVALAELAPSHARVGIPLKGWVPSPANLTQNDAFAAYQDTGRVRNVFLLMQDLAQRGIPLVASVWDAPDWMVTNPSASAQRQLAAGMHDQLAAAIAAFVSHAHDQYGVTIAALSFNESNFGYHLLLSAEEYAAIMRSVAARLQAKGLVTRWLAGETTGVGSLLAYATPVVTDPSTRPLLAALGEHTWDTLLISDQVFGNVANFAQANGLPVWATEVGYDAQLHTQTPNPFPTWDHAWQLALVTQRSLTVGRAAVVHLWSYQNDYPLADALTGELYPAGQVMKQLTDSLHPGATLVAASSSLAQLSPLAGVNDQRNEFTTQVINSGATPLCVAITGVPDRQLSVISSTSAQQRRTLPALAPQQGRVVLVLPAQSITTLSGTLHDGPANQAPVVEAGVDQRLAIGLPLTLSGAIQDDGLPNGSTLSATWSLVSGPGQMVFADANQAVTTATVDVPGVYVLRLSASDGALTGSDVVRVLVLGATLHVNFQTASAAVPHGYLPDSGAAFADRGNGFSYGWNADNLIGVDRDSPRSLDQRYDTSIGMQQAPNTDASWQIAVPNGDYDVHVVAGDAADPTGVFRILVGDTLAISGSPTVSQPWLEATVRVRVSTGRLVVSNGSGAVNNKLCFIDITPVPVVVPTVSFAQTTLSVPETAGTISIPVSLSAVTTQEITVAYAVTDGTAVAGTNYQGPVSGTLTIAAGQTNAVIPVTVLDDQLHDADKTLTLTLSAPTNATLGTSTATTLTITNTDALPVVAFSSATLSVDQQAGTISIPLTLTPASGLPSQVEVAVAAAGSTAVAGTDYTFTPGTVGFAPGATSGTIPLNILVSGNATDQTVVLTLTTAEGATIGAGATMTITIRGTASVPTVAFQSPNGQAYDAVENVSVPVVLGFAAAHDVTVAYTATGISAVNGSVSDPTTDFTLPDGTLTIPAGQTSGVITFTVVNRAIPEYSKMLTITLSAPSGATLGTPSTFTYTIRNDNLPAPVVTYSIGTASGVDIFGLVPAGYDITTLLVSVPSEFTTVSGTVSSSGMFHAHVGNTTPGATSVTCELAFGDAANHQSPTTSQVVAFGDGSGGPVTIGDPAGLPPATPTVTIAITQGLTGQQTGELGGEEVSFTKNNQVTVTVTATTSLGTITAIEVFSSDGQKLDATGGPVNLPTPSEGRIEITATATATYNDQTASGSTEEPTILIVDRTKPVLTYTMPKRYWPATYDQNAVPPPVVPLRQSLTQDRDLVLLNGNGEATNKPLREERGMNVFDAAGFTVEAIVSDESGVRSDVPQSARATALAVMPLTVAVQDPQDPESGEPQTVVISGLAELAESVEYDPNYLLISEYRGRYVLHVVVEDRAGNTLDADAFKLWVKRQPPVLGPGIMYYQDGKVSLGINVEGTSSADTAIDSMRWVVATSDTAEVWQDQIGESQRLQRLLADSDVPSVGYQSLPSGWRLHTPVSIPGDLSGSATVIARDWVGNTSAAVEVTLDRRVLVPCEPIPGGGSPELSVPFKHWLFAEAGYGMPVPEQPVTSADRLQDSMRFKIGDVWDYNFNGDDDVSEMELPLLSWEGVRESWAMHLFSGDSYTVQSVNGRDTTDARAQWSWLVVNPLDPGSDGDTRHATPVILTIPPSWQAAPPPVRVIVRDRGIEAVRYAGLGYAGITLDVLRPDSPLTVAVTPASAGPGNDSLQADVELKRTDVDPTAVLVPYDEEPPRIPASNPGLTRVSYEAWPADPVADENTDPVTEFAEYSSQTGFRWFNLIKLSPDVVATGTRVTIRIEAGFLDDSFRLADFDPEGDYVHFRSGSTDLTLTAAAYAQVTDPAALAGKIAIAGQRLIVDGVNSSLVQTLELDLDIAADVAASLYDVDVKLGAVKEYSDTLSQEHKGENGAHRMKEALALFKPELVDQDDTAYPLIAPISDPHPVITLTSVTVSPQSDATANVVIIGTVEDAVSDFAVGARPREVRFLEYTAPIVEDGAPESDPIWKPHAWRGRFEMQFNMKLRQDDIIGNVTVLNALGNEGSARVVINSKFRLEGPDQGVPATSYDDIRAPLATLHEQPQAGTPTSLELSLDKVTNVTLSEETAGSGILSGTLPDGTTWQWTVAELVVPESVETGTLLQVPAKLSGELVIQQLNQDPVVLQLDLARLSGLNYATVVHVVGGDEELGNTARVILEAANGTIGKSSKSGLVKPLRLRRQMPMEMTVPSEEFTFAGMSFRWQADPEDSTVWLSDKAVMLTQLSGANDPQVVDATKPADLRVVSGDDTAAEMYMSLIMSDNPHDTITVGTGLTVKIRARVAGWIPSKAERAITTGTWKLKPNANSGTSGSEVILRDVEEDLSERKDGRPAKGVTERSTVITFQAKIPAEEKALGLYDVVWIDGSGKEHPPLKEQVRVIRPMVIMLCLDGINGELFQEALRDANDGSGLDMVFGQAKAKGTGRRSSSPPPSMPDNQFFSPSTTKTAVNSLPTITWCNWATIFTGKEPKDHGILGNSFFRREVNGSRPLFSGNAESDYDSQADHRNAAVHGLSPLLYPGTDTIFQNFTAMDANREAVSIHAWYPNAKSGTEFNGTQQGEYGQVNVGANNLRCVRYLLPGWAGWSATQGEVIPSLQALHHNEEGAKEADQISGERALELLTDANNLPSLLAIYFPGPDNVGHAKGRVSDANGDGSKSLATTKEFLMNEVTGTDAQLKRLHQRVERLGVQNAVIWLAVSDHGLMGTNRDLHPHPRQTTPPMAGAFVGDNPLSGGLFSLRDGVIYKYTSDAKSAYKFDTQYRSEMEVFFRRVFEENPDSLKQDETTNTVWYDRPITVNGVPKTALGALWDQEYPVNAIYSPDGGLAHIYVRERSGTSNWHQASGQAGADTLLLAWYLAKESLGEFSNFPGGKPLMPADDPTKSQFRDALAFEDGGATVAGVFVLVGTKYQRAVPQEGLGEVNLVDVNDNMTGGASWKMLKTRLDEMARQTGVSRSGDIVLIFNIKGSYATVNDATEEELNGWHGSPTQAESVTPLVYATPGYGWYPSDNSSLPTSARSTSSSEGEYRNSDVRGSLEALIKSVTGR